MGYTKLESSSVVSRNNIGSFDFSFMIFFKYVPLLKIYV